MHARIIQMIIMVNVGNFVQSNRQYRDKDKLMMIMMMMVNLKKVWTRAVQDDE